MATIYLYRPLGQTWVYWVTQLRTDGVHCREGCQSCSWSAKQEKMNISLSPFASEKLVSRNGFGSPVLRQPAYLHTQTEYGAYLRDSSRFPQRHPFIYLNCHTPSGKSRVYRVTQLRADSVYCRESTGTGSVRWKVEKLCADLVRTQLPSQAIDSAVRVGEKESGI